MISCQARAAAHGRLAAGRFADPLAMELLQPDEQAQVELVRQGDTPKDWGERVGFQLLAATSEVIVPRTVAIDDAIRARLSPQLVILAAGLDARAWRMPELATVKVLEVDHPAAQQNKRERLAGMKPVTPQKPLAGTVKFVPVDFDSEDLDAALAAAGHRSSEPTTWVWEGIAADLTNAEVESTLRVVGQRSAPGSRLILSYSTPPRSARFGDRVTRSLSFIHRRRQRSRRQRRGSGWKASAMKARLVEHGLRLVADDDLATLSSGLDLEVTNPRSFAAGRVAVADC